MASEQVFEAPPIPSQSNRLFALDAVFAADDSQALYLADCPVQNCFAINQSVPV